MTTVECLTAVWGPGAAQLPAPPTPAGPSLAQGRGAPGAPACPQRRGPPVRLSLVETRRAAVVSPAPRAPPSLAPLQAAGGRAAGGLGGPNGAWGERYLGPYAASPPPRRPQPT